MFRVDWRAHLLVSYSPTRSLNLTGINNIYTFNLTLKIKIILVQKSKVTMCGRRVNEACGFVQVIYIPFLVVLILK